MMISEPCIKWIIMNVPQPLANTSSSSHLLSQWKWSSSSSHDYTESSVRRSGCLRTQSFFEQMNFPNSTYMNNNGFDLKQKTKRDAVPK